MMYKVQKNQFLVTVKLFSATECGREVVVVGEELGDTCEYGSNTRESILQAMGHPIPMSSAFALNQNVPALIFPRDFSKKD